MGYGHSGLLAGGLLTALFCTACGKIGGAPDQVEVLPVETAVPALATDQTADLDISATFSIVAVDPETGVCGAAVASKYPAVGSVVPFVRGGAGAFCTQHLHNPKWGPRAIELLADGKPPQEILHELTRDDALPGMRQLAIIDAKGRAACLNPTSAPAGSRWWGSTSGRHYSCQGNTLTGREVVVAMASAYEASRGSLADRLMAALIAGDCAGGDHRGRLAAAVVVAKPGVEGNWLDVHVDKSDDAVLELARKYVALDHEAKGELFPADRPWQHPCADRPEPKPPSEKTKIPDRSEP